MISQDVLDEQLKQHEVWLNDENSGKRLEMRGDLSGVSFYGARLERADLEWIVGEGIDFSNANLKGANFAGCNLKECTFVEANLAEAVFEDSNLEGCDFRDAYAGKLTILRSSIARCNFNGVSMKRGVINDTNGEQNTFVEADLHGTFILGEAINSDFAKNKGVIK